MEDKDIKCIDCGKFFVFAIGEQEFYKGKGYKTPKRCPECREINKQKRDN